MDTFERLADDVFNILPIVTCYFPHYFLCVLSGNNRIEELCHIRLIIIVCFFLWGTDPQSPLVTDPFCASL